MVRYSLLLAQCFHVKYMVAVYEINLGNGVVWSTKKNGYNWKKKKKIKKHDKNDAVSKHKFFVIS